MNGPEKQAATAIWTAHDGGFQLTVAVHGGSVETFTMDAKTFCRQLARALELAAGKAGDPRPDQDETSAMRQG